MSPSLSIELRQSCPSGFTRDDLRYIFSPETLLEFNRWMNGQTMTLCEGKRYHYTQYHGDYCMRPHGFDDRYPAHAEDDDFTWACDYAPGGWYEATVCSGYPEGLRLDDRTVTTGHGPVTYRWDVERFIEGGIAKSIFD